MQNFNINEFEFIILFRIVVLINVLVLLAIDFNFNVSDLVVITSLLFALLWTSLLQVKKKLVLAYFVKSYVFIAMDIFIAFLLISITGGWNSPFYLYSFGPIMLASFYNHIRGGLTAAVFSSVLYSFQFILNGFYISELQDFAVSDSLFSNYLSFFLVGIFFAYPAMLIDQLQLKNQEITQANEKINLLHQLGPLSPRELSILELISGGSTNKDIAQQLFLSEHTVKSHVKNIFQKLGCTSRMQASNIYRESSKHLTVD